jgi:hypothetical protein
MTKSRDWENGGPEMDRRGVERDSPLQQERNVIRKKWAIAVVALLAGALMLPNHEALARGGGGGGHGGSFGGGGFHGGGLGGGFHGGGFGGGGNRGGGFGGRGFSHTLQAAGDLTTEDLAAEDSGAGSAAASEMMDFMAAATLTTTTTTAAIISTASQPRWRLRHC